MMKTSTLHSQFALYILSVCVICNIGYHFFSFPPFVWRLGIVLIGIYYTFVVVFKRIHLPSTVTAILVFAIYNLIGFLISFSDGESSFEKATSIGNILCNLIIIFPFFYFSRINIISRRYLFTFSISLLLTSIFAYYHYEQQELASNMGDGFITNNSSDLFLGLLPLLLMLNQSIISVIIFFVSIFFIVSSAKRGTIIAAIFPSLIFLKGFLTQIWQKSRIYKLATIIMLCFGVYLLSDFIQTNEFLQMRYEQTIAGDSSGRNLIYANAWNHWYESPNIANLIFGYGYMATIPIIGKMAHNDWLELLIDYGLIGALLYLWIFVSLAAYTFKTPNSHGKWILFSILIILGIKSTVSMGYLGNIIIPVAVLGCIMGSTNYMRKKC